MERNVAQATADIENVLTSGKHVEEDAIVQRVNAPRASRADFAAYFGQWKNMKVLIGTAYSWFALDVSPILAL
jgi:PHS family inorganic phosphate transporter-like MFS transporter